MVCKNCPPGTGKGLRLMDVKFDRYVRPGDTYNIYVSVVNNSILVGDWGRVCLWDGAELIGNGGSFYLVKSETHLVQFTGIMPDGDLYLNVSLVDEQIYKLSDCADGYSLVIQASDVTIPVDPIVPLPIPIPTEGDIVSWIMDNLILVLALVLIIIVMMKFG